MDIRSDYKKGMSYVDIARKYNIDPRTAKRYAQSATLPKYTAKEAKGSILDPYKQQIDIWLEEAPYSAVRIYEKVTECGFKGSYNVVKRYVSMCKSELQEKATIRFETMPGLQSQVDWAFFENYRVSHEGRQRKLYCFLMILGYSRMRYIEFVTDMSTTTLIRCHQNAFDYLGGYTDEILYDNMKQVVIKRLLRQADSTLNSQFADFAGFYGFKPILCRPYRGQTKGKVERTVEFVRDNFMCGIRYTSLPDLNLKAHAWCDKVNSKVHATTREVPRERLQRENLNLTTRRYLCDRMNVRKVAKDCLISYGGSQYSVPAGYVGRDVVVVSMDNMLACYFEGDQIAIHRISERKGAICASKHHYRALTVRQEKGYDNPLLCTDKVIDLPIRAHDLSTYDEVV